MATVAESDEAPPTPRIFTKRIPLEQYDEIGAKETEQHLNAMLIHLEQNPELFAEYLRKCRVKQMEQAGFFSNLKVKVLTVIYGEDFVNIDKETQEKKWAEFQSTTTSVYNKAQEAKGNAHKFCRRYSKRIAERQMRKQSENNTTAPPPPPPPPPPPIVGPPALKGTTNIHPKEHKSPGISAMSASSKQCCSAVKVVDDEMKNMSKKIVKRRPLHEVSNITPERTIKRKKRLSSSLQNDILLAKINLRPVGLPDETPYQFCKSQRELQKARENDENAFPLFNQELIRKFRNTRSPQSPKSCSDFERSPSGRFSPT